MDSFGFIESIIIVSLFLSNKESFFIEVISLICYLEKNLALQKRSSKIKVYMIGLFAML